MGEDIHGFGSCPFSFGELRKCGDACLTPDRFASRGEMRHHVAVLLQANRYRRDQNVPAIYRMPNPRELGMAIDFACQFIKVFGNDF